MVTVVVDSIAEVDLSKLKFPTIGIYWHPSDYPKQCVARIFDGDMPTNVVIIKKKLDELQSDIHEHTNLTFLPRGKNEPLSIVGVWI